jgi:hypothetical protein
MRNIFPSARFQNHKEFQSYGAHAEAGMKRSCQISKGWEKAGSHDSVFWCFKTALTHLPDATNEQIPLDLTSPQEYSFSNVNCSIYDPFGHSKGFDAYGGLCIHNR